MVAESVYRDRGYDCVVTSAIDGVHSHGSRHYSGLAVDLRTRNIDAEDMKRMVFNDIKHALGADFDVVLEETHLHIEFDPKAPY